jgi:hypothetical protein
VRELVDGGLLEGDLAALAANLGHQRSQGRAQLFRIQRVDVLFGDHGS